MNEADENSENKGSKPAPRRYPRLLPEQATGEPWRPVMSEQERHEHEQYVKEHRLPF